MAHRPSTNTRTRLGLALTVALLASGCGEDPPPPPPTRVAPPPPDLPEPAAASSCDLMCDRVMACDMNELGSRAACVRRCQLDAPRDARMFECLREPTADGSRRCDLARRCTEVWVERHARPMALSPEHERIDARLLGPDVQISLESRLLNASQDSSRYDLVLLLRGRGQWDGGIGMEDAGEPLDAGSFDGGLQAPDLWVRVGAYTSDGRLPLLRVDPRPDGEAALFQQGSYWARTGDYFRVRHVRDELVIEHAFLQTGPSRHEALESGFEPTLRIQLTPGASVTPLRELVP